MHGNMRYDIVPLHPHTGLQHNTTNTSHQHPITTYGAIGLALLYLVYCGSLSGALWDTCAAETTQEQPAPAGPS
eukprot:3601725-Pyramimonas_sp.AAC.1